MNKVCSQLCLNNHQKSAVSSFQKSFCLLNIVILNRYHYFPDLSCFDYYLFPKLKFYLKRVIFNVILDMQVKGDRLFDTRSKNGYPEMFWWLLHFFPKVSWILWELLRTNSGQIFHFSSQFFARRISLWNFGTHCVYPNLTKTLLKIILLALISFSINRIQKVFFNEKDLPQINIYIYIHISSFPQLYCVYTSLKYNCHDTQIYVLSGTQLCMLATLFLMHKHVFKMGAITLEFMYHK